MPWSENNLPGEPHLAGELGEPEADDLRLAPGSDDDVGRMVQMFGWSSAEAARFVRISPASLDRLLLDDGAGRSHRCGADRALLAWITTLTYDTGFVNFASLTDFFEAFQLARSGVQYRRFEERLQRLLSLSMTLLLRTPTGTARLNMRPIQRAYTPRGRSRGPATAGHGTAILSPCRPEAVRDRPRPGIPRLSAQQPSGTACSLDAQVSQLDVRVYSAAKTVADCFKYRHKIDIDVTVEALRDFSRHHHRRRLPKAPHELLLREISPSARGIQHERSLCSQR